MQPVRAMLAQEGITEQQWRILRVLSERGPLSGRDVARDACLLAPSLTRIVATMVDKGLLTRATDPNDRRSQSLAITGAGQAIIDANRGRAAAIADAWVAQIGVAKYEALLDLLDEVAGLKPL